MFSVSGFPFSAKPGNEKQKIIFWQETENRKQV
jgi:hypothetical protein